MKNKTTYIIIIIIIGIISIGIYISTSSVMSNNILNNDYSYNNLIDLDISEVQLMRYNEKINKTKVQENIFNLSMIIGDGKVSDEGIIKYAIFYAKGNDYLFDKNSFVEDNKIHVKISYVKNIIKKLFNLNISISNTAKFEDIKFNKNYVILDEYFYMEITDVVVLKIDKIVQDGTSKERIIYLDYIDSHSDKFNYDNIINNLNYEVDEELIKKTICIRYTKEQGKYVILDYFEED